MDEDNKPPVQTAPEKSFDYSQPPSFQQSVAPSTTKLIPTGNPKALIAYYLGIFGLIPGLCLFLGPAALVLGIGGLRAYRLNTPIEGKAHAWVGIILGSISTLTCLAILVAALMNKR